MSRSRAILLAVTAALLGACVPSTTAPAPQPVAAPAPRPAATAAPPPMAPVPTPRPLAPTPAPAAIGTIASWADAGLSPGSWSYRREAGQSRALFGPVGGSLFQLACGAGRSVSLVRAGAAAGPLTLRTTSIARTLQGAGGADGLTAQISANDPLLDAIAFSRGRFAVEAPGATPLILPAWPELARVIEDCRR